jgi:putative transposase
MRTAVGLLAGWLLAALLLAHDGRPPEYVAGAVSESLLLDVGSLLRQQFAPSRCDRPCRPERYRVADDLRRPLTEVVAVAEQEAAAFGAGTSAVDTGRMTVLPAQYSCRMTRPRTIGTGVMTATALQAYRFALDPTPRQQRSLASHAGAARFAYNWGLHLVQERLEQRRAGEDIEVPWTLPALRWEWNRAKHQVAPWWPDNSKEAYSSGLDALAQALKNWSDSRNGRRKGRPVGFPRCKTKRRARASCRFTTGGIRVLADRKHIQLPRIGIVRTHESTRKLARRLEHGTARILAATISRTADRWFVSFTVEVQRAIPASNGKASVVGVDVGIRHLAVLSTGAVISNPRALDGSLRRLRRLNRELARRAPASRRRNRTRRRLARLHTRAVNLRRDGLHKLTTGLATRHGIVVVEQLNMAGMVRNRRLARALSDTGMAELRRQLGYKTGWYGCRLLVADRFYPSSKTCSGCGWVRAKLTLAERTFCCESCGLRIDRDLNAARNLAKLVQHVARSGWETQTARGADRKPQLAGQVAMKREAGTEPRSGKTGTVQPQGRTA